MNDYRVRIVDGPTGDVIEWKLPSNWDEAQAVRFWEMLDREYGSAVLVKKKEGIVRG